MKCQGGQEEDRRTTEGEETKAGKRELITIKVPITLAHVMIDLLESVVSERCHGVRGVSVSHAYGVMDGL